MSADVLGATEWAAIVGTDVMVDGEQTWLVEGCSPERQANGWSSWMVTFLAPGVIEQGTYRMGIPGHDDQWVFVVPRGRSDAGTRLDASYTVAAPTEPAESEPRDAAPAESEV